MHDCVHHRKLLMVLLSSSLTHNCQPAAGCVPTGETLPLRAMQRVPLTLDVE